MLFYTDLNQQDFPLTADMVAILPLGAIESHGPHLPLGTDVMIAEAIVDQAAVTLERADQDQRVVMMPTLWLGASDEHSHNLGTLTQEAELLAAQITAIGASLAANGINRLILLNAHGGNKAAAEIASLRLRSQHEMLVAYPHWAQFGLPADLPEALKAKGDVHGGWQETSILMAIRPDLVAENKRTDFAANTPSPRLFPKGPIGWGWMTDDINPAGAIGRADLATPILGAALLDHLGPALADLITDVVAAPWPPEPVA
ncbi:MAG: creatininase family protein [Pseudomonadota bacterium]